MNNFILSTDSCCDQPKLELKNNSIYYIPMSYGDGQNIYFDTFENLNDYQNFYSEFDKGLNFSTAGLNPYQLKEYFLNIIEKEKKDIVHISLSSGLSSTYGFCENVAKEINKNSNYKVYILDSLSATQGQNLILHIAKKLRDDGLFASNAIQELQKFAQKLSVTFFLSDLEVLKRGGRISGAQAVVAKIMQLRLILNFNKEGKLQVKEKVIGSKKAINTLLSLCNNVDTRYPIFIPYSGNDTNAKELELQIKSKLDAEIKLGPVGPVICSHTGTTLTGIIFIAKD